MINKRAQNRKLKGFTIIELLISISILSGVSILLWQTYSTSFDLKKRLEAVNDVYHFGSQIQERIAREVKTAFLVRLPGDNIFNYFIGKEDSIAFTSFTNYPHNSVDRRSDQIEVRYFTEDRSASELNYLKTTRSYIIDGKPDDGGTTYTLLDNLVKLSFEYYDLTIDKYKNEWDSRRDEKNRLPHGVKINFELEDERGHRYPFQTYVTLAMADARPGERAAATPTPVATATPAATPTAGGSIK